MSRRKTDNDIICGFCGHPIKEEHEFYVHQRGTKNDYITLHGECLDGYSKRNRNDKKTKQNASRLKTVHRPKE